MTTIKKARQLAAQAWCDPETSGKVMDPELAEAFARRLATLIEVGDDLADLVVWMTGSGDFAPEGVAGEGWAQARPRLNRAMRFLADPASPEGCFHLGARDPGPTPAVRPPESFRLIATVGLPRSGKSTWAKSTGLPIVNPDAIRLALHGQRFFAPAEPFVWALAFAMVESLRLAGHERVVLDATNVQQKRRAEWETRFRGQVEYHLVPTPPEVCIERARAQADEEIVPVIERMAAQWDFPERWP